MTVGRLHDIVGVPTSRATAVLAEQLGIPLLADDFARPIDVTIDGADEVNPELDLIKGGAEHCCARRLSHHPAIVW